MAGEQSIGLRSRLGVIERGDVKAEAQLGMVLDAVRAFESSDGSAAVIAGAESSFSDASTGLVVVTTSML